MLIALTYLNASYVASDGGLGLALFFEGLALIAVGLLADRARRLLRRRRPGAPVDTPPEPLGAEAPTGG